MTTRSIRRFACTAALLALATAAPGHAADKIKEGSFGTKSKGGGPLLTRAQLRECIAQQERVATSTTEMVPLRSRFDADKAEIERQGTVLKAQLEALDRSSQEAVDKYNEQALARDKLIDEFEARAAVFNQKVDALQAARAAFASGCENRRYDEADEIAIRKGK